MKKLFFIGLAILATLIGCYGQNSEKPHNSNSKFHDKIDEITTDIDIDNLLDSIDKKKFDSFVVKEKLAVTTVKCSELAEKIKAQSWKKADFDSNGFTDILIIGNLGQESVVVLNNGKNNFVYRILTKGYFSECQLPVVKKKDSQTVIDYYGFLRDSSSRTLVYKFGEFVEFNESPQIHNIEKIEYKVGICFGSCPAFEIEIAADRQGIYKPLAFNKKKSGTFREVINKTDFDEITGLLNYIDFPHLNDAYSVGWTDDQASVLTIIYDGGKVKKIQDYGLIGTFGLSSIYKKLFDLRENQVWKK